MIQEQSRAFFLIGGGIVGAFVVFCQVFVLVRISFVPFSFSVSWLFGFKEITVVEDRSLCRLAGFDLITVCCIPSLPFTVLVFSRTEDELSIMDFDFRFSRPGFALVASWLVPSLAFATLAL
jgi:hypothetical protein